ncbi:MAG: hypothetical protein ACHQ4H_07655, partial [Ktedonobacterales bacterium]
MLRPLALAIFLVALGLCCFDVPGAVSRLLASPSSLWSLPTLMAPATMAAPPTGLPVPGALTVPHACSGGNQTAVRQNVEVGAQQEICGDVTVAGANVTI